MVTAAKNYGCKAVGYDIDPGLVKLAREKAKKDKLEHLVKIKQEDFFTVDLSQASVVTLYLLPQVNAKLIPQLEKLRAGSRIVAHELGIPGVQPDRRVTYVSKEDGREHTLYLWTAPLRKKEE